jgi:DNA-binding beta-propeller fold protein YncE
MNNSSRRRVTGAIATLTCVLTLTASTVAVGASSSRNSTHEFNSPSGLAYVGGHLWVTNAADSSVSEIDPSTGAWLANLRSPGFGFFHPIAVVALGGELFVLNANDTLTELRASNGALVRRISGAQYRLSDPVALTTVGNDVLILNSGPVGSITEVSASTGAYILNIRGRTYALDNPAAFAVTGTDVFVANKSNNSVTEVDATTGKLIRVVAGHGLAAPDGVAIGSGNVWVADQFTSGVTEISAITGAVLANKTDANGSYGFWHPTVMISTGANIYVATPLGTSPMVTKISATTAKPYWFMCNTNGPYYFSLLSAFAVAGAHLWVASRSGANSKIPGAATGSLTELSLGSGTLIKTLPTH